MKWKFEVCWLLDKEWKNKDRVHLKLLEYEIQQLEDDEMKFADCIVKRLNKHDDNKNLTA